MGRKITEGRGGHGQRRGDQEHPAAEIVGGAAEWNRQAGERETISGADEAQIAVVCAKTSSVQWQSGGDHPSAQVEDERDETNPDQFRQHVPWFDANSPLPSVHVPLP
jgi:hypothetical protein